jgi:hypothetical protein
MELNVNEPLMKHRYCYQITSEIGLRLRSMIRREVTCLLSLWCTVCRRQDHYIGSLMEREKQIENVKRKCQRRMTRKAESGFLRSSVEVLVMRRERRGKRIQRTVLCNLIN